MCWLEVLDWLDPGLEKLEVPAFEIRVEVNDYCWLDEFVKIDLVKWPFSMMMGRKLKLMTLCNSGSIGAINWFLLESAVHSPTTNFDISSLYLILDTCSVVEIRDHNPSDRAYLVPMIGSGSLRQIGGDKVERQLIAKGELGAEEFEWLVDWSKLIWSRFNGCSCNSCAVGAGGGRVWWFCWLSNEIRFELSLMKWEFGLKIVHWLKQIQDLIEGKSWCWWF